MSFRKEIVSGVFWNVVRKYSGLLIQLPVTAILSRLLSPEEFGLIAVAMVLIVFVNLLTDMGIGPAIIQQQDLKKSELDSIFSFCILGGSVVALLFFMLSGVVGDFYNDSSLSCICKILSINILFSSCNIVPNALVYKDKRFKFIALRTLILQVLSGIMAIIAAYNGMGVYTLLISPIFTSFTAFIINYKEYPLAFLINVDIKALKKISSFSIFQFLFNFINYFSRNLDKLIVGRYLGMNELGYYEKSYSLMLLPLNYITNVINPVIHPIFASYQRNLSLLFEKYNSILRYLSIVSFPIGAYLYFTANDIISIIYGDNWEAAVPTFQILALSLPLQMLLSTTGAIYQATGKTNWMFYVGLSNTLCTIGGFFIATIYFKTIESVAWAWNITLFVNTLNSFSVLFKIILREEFCSLLKVCIYPFVLAIIMSAILLFLEQYIIECNSFLHLLVITIVSFLVWILYVRITGKYKIEVFFLWRKDK